MKRRGKAWLEEHRDAVRIRTFDDDGKRKRTLRSYPREQRAAAERYVSAWNAEVREGAIERPNAVTLARYGDDWLDRREIDGSRVRAEVRSVHAERSVWRRHVAPSELGQLALDAISTADVERFARWLRTRERVSAITVKVEGERETKLRKTGARISKQTQRHALRLVRQVLEDARIDGAIDTNPAAGIRVAPDAGAARDLTDDWLRSDEIAKLLACDAIAIVDRRAYAVAIGLAVRLRSLQSIEVAHVHLDAEVPGPHVEVVVGKKRELGARQRVPVMPWLVPILRDQIASLPEGARWLFPTRDGDRYHPSHDFGWAPKVERGRPRRPGALERAGIERRIRLHDLRGTAATHLALGSWGRQWSLHEIQTMLAHSDQRVTERYVRRALDALAAAARGTADGPAIATGASPSFPQRDAEVRTGSTGFEPVTFGSGGPRAPERSREVSTAGGSDGGSSRRDAVEAAARSVLERADDPAIDALAGAVLGAAATAPAAWIRTAVELRDGAPRRAWLAMELAELVVAAAIARASGEGDAAGAPTRH
jgi:integrase